MTTSGKYDRETGRYRDRPAKFWRREHGVFGHLGADGCPMPSREPRAVRECAHITAPSRAPTGEHRHEERVSFCIVTGEAYGYAVTSMRGVVFAGALVRIPPRTPCSELLAVVSAVR